MDDFIALKAEAKEQRDQKKKEEEDNRKGLDLRRAAMQGIPSMCEWLPVL